MVAFFDFNHNFKFTSTLFSCVLMDELNKQRQNKIKHLTKFIKKMGNLSGKKFTFRKNGRPKKKVKEWKIDVCPF